MKLTRENIMNNVQPDKVTLAFGLFVLSKQDDESVQMYLEDFRELFIDMLRNKSKRELPNGDTKDPVVQQHNNNTITKDVEVTTERSMLDLEMILKNLSLDKSSWKKVFKEELQ
tara:strand:+ start:615 stop:956 length:342 start_codon:yes stop_codon:yes gene_type:complete